MRQLAIIGLGFVSDLYMRSLAGYPDVTLKAVFDRDPERRRRFVAHWRAIDGSALCPDTVLAEDLGEFLGALVPGDVVVNLTNPAEHFEVSRACLEAGMHVYSEKPLATDMNDARALHALSETRGLMLASAPCSVLGEAAQMLWAALREGVAGTPRLVYAEQDEGFLQQAPTEHWVSPSGAPWPRADEFRTGCTLEHAGYYLTWLLAMFGSVRTVVAASARIVPDKLAADEGPAAPDFSCGILFFESGVVARLTNSIVARHDHRLQVICDGGTLELDEAWNNAAAVRFRRRFRLRRRLVEHPLPRRLRPAGATHPKVKRFGAAALNFALGPIEMLEARDEGRRCRLTSDFALHLNEVTLGLQNSGEHGGSMAMTTRLVAPMEPMPWARLKR